MSDDATITVNGKTFGAWETVDITISLEAVASSFSLGVSDGDGSAVSVIPINEQDSCIVKIGDEKIITGYVDDVVPSFGAQEHSINIAGRSKTCDLVDCSVLSALEWQNKKFDAIAKELASPFGIGVKLDADAGGVIKQFKIQPGDSPYDTLAKAAKGIGLILVPDSSGNFLITKGGGVATAWSLLEGENILHGEAHFSMKDRYSKIVTYGQGADIDSFSMKGTATDNYVKRYRPLVVLAEDGANQSYLTKRAQWEAKVRAARAAEATIVVQGWRAGDGRLWSVNRLVSIKAPTLRLDGQLLISELTFHKGEDGTTTTLKVRRKDAYSQEPTVSVAAEPEKKPTKPSPAAAPEKKKFYRGITE